VGCGRSITPLQFEARHYGTNAPGGSKKVLGDEAAEVAVGLGSVDDALAAGPEGNKKN